MSLTKEENVESKLLKGICFIIFSVKTLEIYMSIYKKGKIEYGKTLIVKS